MYNFKGKWRVPIAAIGGFAAGAIVIFLMMAAGLFNSKTPLPPNKEWGEFLSAPSVELLDDGRMIRLLEDFAYIDPRGNTWVAPKDLVVDGASIPRAFWSITGGPLEGRFRNASIVHDEGCIRKTKSWEDVHLMFYEACRCGGVPEKKAKVLYAAVYHFGPRWVMETFTEQRQIVDPDGQEHTITVKQIVARTLYAAEPDTTAPEQLEKYVNQHNPSLEQLREIDPRSL